MTAVISRTGVTAPHGPGTESAAVSSIGGKVGCFRSAAPGEGCAS